MLYRVQNQVASDVFDEEVVIVDLAQGNYFSIQGGGKFLWDLLGKGLDIEAFLHELQSRYSPEQGLVEAFKAHIETLKTEKLITVLDEQDESDATDNIEWPASMIEPSIEVYKDLQDLLLLDPIHGLQPDQAEPSESSHREEIS